MQITILIIVAFLVLYLYQQGIISPKASIKLSDKTISIIWRSLIIFTFLSLGWLIYSNEKTSTIAGRLILLATVFYAFKRDGVGNTIKKRTHKRLGAQSHSRNNANLYFCSYYIFSNKLFCTMIQSR
jgi:quinol-cytochrome oxidoreductase complex cytochrome b subunit